MKLHRNAKSSLILAKCGFMVKPRPRSPVDRSVEESQVSVVSVSVGTFALNSCELLAVAKFGEAQTFTLIVYFSVWYILILVINFFANSIQTSVYCTQV
jgi:hypothetical protein